jgi:hypothetical protein
MEIQYAKYLEADILMQSQEYKSPLNEGGGESAVL